MLFADAVLSDLNNINKTSIFNLVYLNKRNGRLKPIQLRFSTQKTCCKYCRLKYKWLLYQVRKNVWGKNELKLHLYLVFTIFSGQQKPAWKFLYTLNDAIIMKVSHSIRLERLLFLARLPNLLSVPIAQKVSKRYHQILCVRVTLTIGAQEGNIDVNDDDRACLAVLTV